MGIEPFLLSSSLQVVAAQRLVRRICEHCHMEAPLSKSQTQMVKEMFELIPEEEVLAYGLKPNQPIIVQQGKGCDKCGLTGYKGRIALYETVAVDTTMRDIIADKQGNEAAVKEAAIGQKMLSMRQDGILKVLKGITTLAEVERVTEGKLLIDEE